MISKVKSAAISGLDAVPIDIEIDIGSGLPVFMIVGLPDKSVEESRERVKSAIKNSKLKFPSRKITVNLAPADLKKEGSLFDLPIAVSIVASSDNDLKIESSDMFIGELSLSGEVKRVNGILPIAVMAKNLGIRRLFVPSENAIEASFVRGAEVYPVASFSELISGLKKELPLKRIKTISLDNIYTKIDNNNIDSFDISLISGQEHAKRALEIAASGGHNIFLFGPPGTGKTLLAKAFSSILPKMSFDEILEVSKIYSISGLLSKNKPLLLTRPVRNPHHTASHIALVGGGQNPKPGEISLSHRGVLFLDEFPEFPSSVLEVLREPLEERKITISRASGRVTYPSNFILVAAANPCPCGYYQDEEKECVCSNSDIVRYNKKISGPLLDRIDIFIKVPRVKYEKLKSENSGESSSNIRRRVEEARKIQENRFLGTEIKTNSEMGIKEIRTYCRVDKETDDILKNAVDNLILSARGLHKILKLARTIADLDNSKDIQKKHVLEAIQYRNN